MNPTDELVSRKQFLEKLKISDSSERRKRKGGDDWPPHLLIGKKVYYRCSAVDNWLRLQEAICGTADHATAGVAGNE